MNSEAKKYLSGLNLTSKKNTKCSDWHLGWGYGNNKFGKLHLLNDGSFFWFGEAQGRHDQKYGSNFIHFDKNLDKIFGRWSIDLNEVRKAVEILTLNK